VVNLEMENVMKKLLVALFAAAALALVLAPVVNAAPAEKVVICHVNAANDYVDAGYLGTFVFGMMTEVAAPALPAHFNHGDADEFKGLDSYLGKIVIAILERLGLALPNADCLFRV